MKDNRQKGKYPQEKRIKGLVYRGRPRKDIPLQEIRIANQVHLLIQLCTENINDQTSQNISYADFCGSLIEKFYSDFSQGQKLPLLSLTKRIKVWHKPWTSIHISYENHQHLKTMVQYCNESLSPRKQKTLKYGVNVSNLISAMIYTKALTLDLPIFDH